MINGRPLVNKVIRNCSWCILKRPNIYRTLNFPPIPEQRTSFGYPFQDIGVDLTEHYQIKVNGKIIKRYITIFTCLSTRAVHAVISKDNSVLSFVHSFSRHMYQYGPSRSMYCDNAQNFKSASNILYDHANCT